MLVCEMPQTCTFATDRHSSPARESSWRGLNRRVSLKKQVTAPNFKAASCRIMSKLCFAFRQEQSEAWSCRTCLERWNACRISESKFTPENRSEAEDFRSSVRNLLPWAFRCVISSPGASSRHASVWPHADHSGSRPTPNHSVAVCRV